MIYTLSNINDYSNMDIYNDIAPELQKTHEFASYIGISEPEFQNIALKVIEQSKNAKRINKNINDYIYNRINIAVNRILETKLNDVEVGFEIVNRYINDNFKNSLNYNKAIEAFNKLDIFFRRCQYIPDPDLLIKLINENEILAGMVKTLYEKNANAIKNGYASSLFKNETLIQSINTYCLINNIEIKEITYEDLDNINPNDEIYLYKKDISRYPLLSPSKEYELATRMKQGDEIAKEEFINSNLRLVLSAAVKIAAKYRVSGLSLSDLIQEGNIGLLIVAEKFDPEKGYKFSTYATHWIRRYILSSILNKARTIKVPVNKMEQIYYFRSSYYRMADTLGREPTFDELSKELKLDKKTVLEYYMLLEDTVSLNEPVGSEEGIELGNLIADKAEGIDDVVIKEDLPKEIQQLFISCKLKEKEKYILIKRYGLLDNKKETLEAIGKTLHMSRERVRQIEANSLRKLRNSPNINAFAVYMDNSSKSNEKIEKFRVIYANPNNKYKKHLKEHSQDNNSNSNSNIEIPKTRITIYDLMPEYTRDEVDGALLELSSEDRNKIYDNIYDKKVIKPIVRKMNKYIEKTRNKNNPDETIKVTRKKTKKTAPVEKTTEQTETESPFVIQLRNIERRNRDKNRTINRIQEEVENVIKVQNKKHKILQEEIIDPRIKDIDAFREMISKMTNAKYAIIISMKYGLIDGITHDDEDLSKKFCVPKDEVKVITETALESHIEKMTKNNGDKTKTLTKKKL